MKKVCLLAVFLLALSTIGSSKTIHVPGNFNSIRTAVQLADEGDEIIVAPGTYVENVIFNGKDIVVRSSGGPEVTVIDGKNPAPSYWGSVVIFWDNESADCVLDGFTLINGRGTNKNNWGNDDFGGGVYCNCASPTLKNLIVTENSADFGGGIYCDGGSNPILIDNIITDNQAYGYDSKGGGLYCLGDDTHISNQYISGNYAKYGGGIALSCDTATISNNTIIGNSSEDGGGIWLKYGTVTITDNIISNNTAENGGGIYNDSTGCIYDRPFPITIRNNLITENTADIEGAGIWLNCSEGSSVSCNTISDNTAGQRGGGMYWLECSPSVRNNVFNGNSAELGGGGIFCRKSSPLLMNNCFAGNLSNIGGGVYCHISDSVHISGCTFSNNIADQSGGGLALQTATDTTITNSIFWENGAPSGPAINDLSSSHIGELSLQYSDVEGGQSSVQHNPELTLHWGDGMIDADPLFADPDQNDYRLKQEPCHPGEHSPCVDTGDCDAVFGGTTRSDAVRDSLPVDMGYHYSPNDPLIIKVPADFMTLQNAINATWDKDLVIVSPGTYVENIDFQGKAIYVKSSGGPATTIIDGGMPANPETGSVVLFNKGESKDSVLDGFTLMNGTGTSINDRTFGGGICCIYTAPLIKNNVVASNSAEFGGGLYVDFACPEVRKNRFQENAAIFEGGGIGCYMAAPLIESNEVANNWVTNGPGGGICCTGESVPQILNNLISGNSALQGGGVACQDDCWPDIEGNSVIDNNAVNQGGGLFLFDEVYGSVSNNLFALNHAYFGGGITLWDSHSTLLESNRITENTAVQNGGGIHFVYTFMYRFQNNMIWKNTAQAGGGISCTDSDVNSTYNTIWGNSADNGGGMILLSGSKPEFINTIFSKNSATQGSEIELRGGYNATELLISYSNVEGGPDAVHVDPGCSIVMGDGILVTDPLLVDPENGDFHLSYSSPCRDMGTMEFPHSFFPPATDFEGDNRFAADFTDMGADEFHDHLYCTGDFAPSGQIKGKITGEPGTYPIGLFIGSGVLETPMHHLWGEFYLESPWLFVPLVPIPSHGVLVIPTQIPGNTAGPYDIPLQALIGDSFSNLFVLEVR